MEKIFYDKVNLLRQNARLVVRELGLLNDAYFEIGVTLAERHLLIELSASPLVTAKELGERLLLEKSTMSRLIAKAEKKGYITTSLDRLDKRKRLIQMTPKGIETLNAFEPIAFQQTKEALETLSAVDQEVVYRGVALYAEGLKKARNQEPSTSFIESLQEIEASLQGSKITRYETKDESALYEIYKEVIQKEDAFIWGDSLSEFKTYFLAPLSEVYLLKSSSQEVLGAFYIKPNFPGRSSHIANSGYMMKSSYQGKGLGKLLIKASLHIAKRLGFQAMQFNIVFSKNMAAIKLYQTLGFSIVGTLPEAVKNQDGSYQAAHIMYRTLGDVV